LWSSRPAQKKQQAPTHHTGGEGAGSVPSGPNRVHPNPTHPPRTRSTPPPNGRSSTRVREQAPRDSQARFHIIEPCSPDTNGRARTQTSTHPPQHGQGRLGAP